MFSFEVCSFTFSLCFRSFSASNTKMTIIEFIVNERKYYFYAVRFF